MPSNKKKIKRIKHKDGCLEYREYLNGKHHGKWISWYPDGIKDYEGEYLNGERHGKSTWWRLNGNIRYESEYDNGDLIPNEKRYEKQQ